MTYETTTTDSAATKNLAARIAHILKGGEVIELVSDLGGGKTTFVQGLMDGFGYTGEVTSPTFTLSHTYKINDELEVHHYDLYRLGTAGIMIEELAEDMHDAHIITVIEWAGIVESELPTDRLIISFKVIEDEQRKITFSAIGKNAQRVIKEIAT